MQIHKSGGGTTGLHLVKNNKSCGWGSVNYWYSKHFYNNEFSFNISENTSSAICRYLLVSDELTEW